MAYRYPEKLDKVEQPDGSVLSFRPKNAPTRVAYDTDWNTWYEEVKIDG